MTTAVHASALSADLLMKFRPAVLQCLDPWIQAINRKRQASIHFKQSDLVAVRYDVIYVRPLTGADQMYLFTVALEGGAVFIHELREIGEVLIDKFGAYEEPASALKGSGLRFTIGDGDDNGAVQFKDGRFTIWLRGWGEDRDV